MPHLTDYVSPDWARAVLITVDTQNDFTLHGAPGEVLGTLDAVPQMQRLVRAFRESEKPIIHVVRIYLPDASNVDNCRRRDFELKKQIAVAGTNGTELVDELKPSPQIRLDTQLLLSGGLQLIGRNEWIMYKPRWGAFFETLLERHLKELGSNTLVVCGCNFPNCPRSTIYEASERNFRIVLVTDAVSGVYDRAL